jgi:hypothetical protein
MITTMVTVAQDEPFVCPPDGVQRNSHHAEPARDQSFSMSMGSRALATTRAQTRSPHPVHLATGRRKVISAPDSRRY